MVGSVNSTDPTDDLHSSTSLNYLEVGKYEAETKKPFQKEWLFARR